MKTLQAGLGGLWVVVACTVLACSSSENMSSPNSSPTPVERLGRVGLSLQPVSGITVTSVKYTVTAGNAPGSSVVQIGNLPTPGTASSFNFGISLPVGTGYYLSLSAVAQESPVITCTSSFGPFAVLPNQSSPFSMSLVCVDSSQGSTFTSVDVKTDACPRLVVDYVVAEPGTAGIGLATKLYSAAHDLDDAAAIIKYTWTLDAANAAVGSFQPASAANTSFTCALPRTNVPVTVTATNSQCSKSLSTYVSCRNPSCGNGLVETQLGETCDFAAGPNHPADPTCPFNCVKVCGNGNVEGDEQCDPLPANPASCVPPGDPKQCTLRITTCGDGFVTGTEVCDPLGNVGPGQVPLPAGTVCSVDCTTSHPPTCGDGVVAVGEQCDAGTGTNSSPVPKGSRTCGSNCVTISSPACVDCEQAGDCAFSSDNCENPAFTAAQKLTCYQTMQCIEVSGCLGGTGSLGKCYCGTLSTANCGAAPYDLSQPGAPNGPCAAIMQAGQPGVTSSSAMLGALTNKSRPAGAAGQRLNCDKTDPSCAPLCLASFGTCGNGVVDSGEECDPGPTGSTICGADCKWAGGSEGCVACERAGDCFASTDNCLGSFSPTQQAQCNAVDRCLRSSGCMSGSGNLGKCYCGTLSVSACGAAPYDLSQPGAPNGPCAAVIQAGLPGVSVNTAALGALTSKGRPSGAAGQRVNCDKLSCPAACGLQ